MHGPFGRITNSNERVEVALPDSFQWSNVRVTAETGNNFIESIRYDIGTCDSGYTGDETGACTDDDECSLGTDNCDTNASCTNIDGSFSCACNSGYSGDGVTCDADVLKCVKFTTADGTSAEGYFGFTAKSTEGRILSSGNFYFSEHCLQTNLFFNKLLKNKCLIEPKKYLAHNNFREFCDRDLSIVDIVTDSIDGWDGYVTMSVDGVDQSSKNI